MQQFCRTCLLKIPDVNFVTLNNEDAKAKEVRAELSACLPELQQDLVRDPVICTNCVSVLHVTYTFKMQCLDIERSIRHFKQNTKINVECLTLTELFNITMGCNSQSNSGVNNPNVREFFTGSCTAVTEECFINEHKVSNVKKEYPSDEEERTNDFSASSYKVSNVVGNSDIPMEQAEEQSDFQNLATNFKIIAGMPTHYDELTEASLYPSSVGVYTVGKDEILQETNDTGGDGIIKEEHELVTFKTETLLKEKILNDCTINVDEEPIKECFVNIQRLPNPSDNLMNESSFTTEAPLQHTTKKPENIRANRKLFRRNFVKQERLHSGNNKSFRCRICNFTAVSKLSLLEHSRHHIGKKGFCCLVCEYSAVHRESLKIHMRGHTGERPFCCNICEFNTARKVDLTEHMRTHTGEKPFSCKICGFSTARRRNLASHMRTHTGEKPFRCNLCEYRTARKSRLLRHIRFHTDDKPFSCKLCEFNCANKEDLVKHMQNHTIEKPYHCNVCDYRATEKGTLVKHMQTHTGEKPFRCNMCEYSAARRGTLVRHMRTHTGEKPFRCKICPFGAAQKGSLVKHMRTHTGEKPFRCTVCEYRAAQKGNLVAHMRTHAANTLLQEICANGTQY